MKGKDKSQEQLKIELEHLRKRVAELESVNDERKRVEEALQASEIKYRNLFNNAQAGLFRTRISDGKVLDCNEMFARLTGFGSREECLAGGISSQNYANPADRERIVKEMQEKGYVRDVEIEIARRDGQRFWVSYSAYIYPKSDCIEGVVVDITERKKAEEDLRKSEERFRTLIESSLDVTIILDVQGNIIYLSPNFESVWGRGAAGLVGRDMFKDIHPDDIPLVGDAFARLLKKPKEPVQMQVKAMHVDGTWRNVDAVAHNHLENPAVRGIVINFRDATERKRVGEALRLSEARFKAQFHGDPTATVIWQKKEDDFVLANLNEAAKSMARERAAGLIGVKAKELYKNRQDIMQLIDQCITENRTIVKELRSENFSLGRDLAVAFTFVPPDMVIAHMEDITERKRMEKALRESEEKYSTLVENATDGVTIIQDKVIKFANKRMSEISGYTIEELTGMSSFDLVPPDFIPELDKRFAMRAQGTEVPEIWETKMLCKDGTVKEIESSTELIQYKGKTAAMGVSRDVTERKRMEERLRRNEEKYRALVEQSLIGIGISKSNQVMFANAALLRIFGYNTPEEFVKIPLMDHIEPSSRGVISDLMKKRDQGKAATVDIEYDILCKDGTTRTVHSYVSHFTLENEIYTQSIFEDITGRKQSEDALKMSEERFAKAFKASPEAISISYIDNGMYVDVNDNFLGVTGFQRDEVIGHTSAELNLWVDRDDRSKIIGKIVSDGYVRDYEVKYRMRSGGIRDFLVSAELINLGGKACIISFIRDITERKRMEAEVVALSNAFRAALDPVLILDIEGNVRNTNEAARRLFETEEVGINALEYVVPEDKDRLAAAIQDLIINGRASVAQFNVITRSGRRVPLEASGSLIRDAGGKPVGIVVVERELTERKQAEEALREAKDYAERLIRAANVLVVGLDVEGKVTLLNEAGEKITGYKAKEVIGRNWFELIVPKKRYPYVWDEFNKVKDAGTIIDTFENPILTKSGEERIVSWKNSAQILGGKIVGTISFGMDVTERKRMEEMILRISKAVESSSDAIGMSDPQGHHFYHNKAFTELFEYTPEELEAAGGGPAAFVNKNIARKVFDTIMGGGSWSGEVEMVSKSGRKFMVLERADAIKDESGRVIGLVGMHTDITERKRAEENLRETRDYMENLIEHANVPMVVWTPDFRITRFNRAFERLTGMKAKAVVGKDLEILFPVETRERSMSYMRTAVSGARWEVVEIPIVNAQGDVKTVLWNISAIYAEDRKTPIAIIAQGQDITERKQAEEALRESEEMARSMLDNAAMGVYLLQNKKFLYVNPTFEKIMGYTSAELVGQEAINYVHPGDRAIVRMQAVENLKGISVLPYEFRVLRKDGKQIWVMERVTSIRYKGRRAAIASFMETTEHRKAEEELERAYDELKTAHDRMVQSEKLRAMGEMASGIAHDFNNMLAVILGRTQLVIDDVKDDKVKKGIQIIEQAALDAAKTVKRLQDFARIRLEHPFESLDVNEVAEVVLKMVEPRVIELEQTKGITIQVEQEFGKVGQVSGDAAELREALLNILFNAIDAMPTGGKLTVKSEQDEDWVQISITDTGVGIPDKVKKKVFDPFFTTKASKGSGLGLSVTYGIISRHRGMIRFDSEVGKGTTFYIRLPLTVEVAKKETKKGKAVAAKPANILAVDDEPEVLNALELTLEYFGHWVKGFTRGAEAIKAFKDGNYDLVITDLGMPEVSGWDVARAIKKMKPDVPVLLITGWVVDLDEEQKKIVDGVITKPFSRESISSAITQVFPAKKKPAGGKSAGKKSK